MFEKLQTHVNSLPNSFEKVVILKNYSDFLLEKDKNTILAISKVS